MEESELNKESSGGACRRTWVVSPQWYSFSLVSDLGLARVEKIDEGCEPDNNLTSFQLEQERHSPCHGIHCLLGEATLVIPGFWEPQWGSGWPLEWQFTQVLGNPEMELREDMTILHCYRWGSQGWEAEQVVCLGARVTKLSRTQVSWLPVKCFYPPWSFQSAICLLLGSPSSV